MEKKTITGIMLVLFLIGVLTPTFSTSPVAENALSMQLLTNTGVVGFSTSIYENIIAFDSQESRVGEDLNGDGDLADHVIRYYDIVGKTLSNTGVEGWSPVIYGNIIAFYNQEDIVDKDLNGDGDKTDMIISYYNISTQTYVNTGIDGSNPSLYGNIIVFHTDESFAGVDLNKDGDTWDVFIRYYDISTGNLLNTGIEGIYPSIYESTIAFDAYWAKYYDLSTKQVVDLNVRGMDVDVYGDIITFQTQESDVGKDLNGDGDNDDAVIWEYIISARNLRMIDVDAWDPDVQGDIIAFEVWESVAKKDLNRDGDTTDEVVGYYSTIAENLVITGIDGLKVSVYGNVIVFTTFEHRVGIDLNSDGDMSDSVIRYLSLPKSKVNAVVDINPVTSNLKSKGQWIAAYIGLPEGYNVGDIDVSTILLNDEVPAESTKVSGKILMVKFDRSKVITLLSQVGEVELTVTGKLFDGTRFEGSDTIRVR